MAPRKILVVALDNLGDAVMASAVFEPVKKMDPSAVLGLWAKEYTAGLFEGHPFVDRVHAADPFWDGSPGRPSGRFLPFVSALNAIRNERYDTAVLLNTEWRRTLAARVAGIPARIGYDRRHSKALLTRVVPTPSLSQIQHFSEDHRALLMEAVGAPTDAAPWTPSLFVSPREQTEFEAWNAGPRLVPQTYWVAHLFSGDPLKNWPVPRWIELIEIRRIQHPHQRCAVLLGPSEAGKLTANERQVLAEKTEIVSEPSLGLLKAVLKNALIVVAGDSGPGHVAAALRTPVVSLFGPTNPLRSRPLGSFTRIVSAPEVMDIAVNQVTSAMEDLT